MTSYEDGFYWVKHFEDDEWDIAAIEENLVRLVEHEEWWNLHVIHTIGPRIESPDETP